LWPIFSTKIMNSMQKSCKHAACKLRFQPHPEITHRC
jgi:hypothetical protein